MAIETLHMILEFGFEFLVLGASLLLQIEILHSHAPEAVEGLHDFQNLEHAVKRRIMMMLLGYGGILLVAWRLLKSGPKKRKLRLIK